MTAEHWKPNGNCVQEHRFSDNKLQPFPYYACLTNSLHYWSLDWGLTFLPNGSKVIWTIIINAACKNAKLSGYTFNNKLRFGDERICWMRRRKIKAKKQQGSNPMINPYYILSKITASIINTCTVLDGRVSFRPFILKILFIPPFIMISDRFTN